MKLTGSYPAVATFQAAMLLLFSILILLQRWHTFDEPLDRDISGYAVIGHEMLQGRQLYTDLWERKPPLLFVTFAAAQRLIGYGPGEIFLLNVGCAIGTLGAIYFAGGVFAAVLWTIFCGDMWVQGNQPNAEAFVNLFIAWGFAVLMDNSARRRLTRAVVVGSLFAAATLYKHHTIVICVGILLARLWSDRTAVKARLVDSAIALSVIIAVWICLLIYFRAVGRWDAISSALFRQNAAYAGGLSANLVHALWWKNLYPQAMRWSLAPLMLILAWMVFGARNISPRTRILCVGYIVSAWVTVALPGHFFAHYYQLLLPPLCVTAGLCVTAMLQPIPQIPSILRIGIICVVMALSVCWEGSSYQLNSNQWALEKDEKDDLPRQRQLAIELNRMLKPGELFWELGDDNILYFDSGRSPPSGLLYMEPLATGPERSVYGHRLMRDLLLRTPDLIIADRKWESAIPTDSGVQQWMSDNYLPYNSPLTNGSTLHLFLKRRSNVALRLGAGSR